MTRKVALVTDSTASIPDELLRGNNITVIPLQVNWGEQTYLDGIDIQPGEFYERLKTASVMPFTSQPSPDAFKQVYSRLIEQDFDVLTVIISEKLSGTYNSAVQAKQMLPGANIEIVDSEATSMMLGFQVLAAAECSRAGGTLKECKAVAEHARSNTGAFFVVNTLEFLRRGGRISHAAALIGTALNVKPILHLSEGRIQPLERVRTMSKAIDRLQDLVAERLNGKTPIRIATVHGAAPREAQNILDSMRSRYPVSSISMKVLTDVGPVIGTHTGPGALGILYHVGM